MENKKVLNLKAHKLNDSELEIINGGVWHFIGGAILGGLIYDLVTNPQDCLDSFNAGREYVRNL